MTLHEKMVASIRTSTEQVFSTMLGAELGEGEGYSETTPPQATDGILSFIGLAGPWAGTGSVGCSVAAACSICAQMLMTEASTISEEVLDAVAELTNMIVGNVKTDLENDLGALGLSIPTVVWGRNFRAKTNVHGEWSCVRYVWNGEPITIRMCLAPTEPAHHAIPQCSVQAVDV